jgi:hypothetical protein
MSGIRSPSFGWERGRASALALAHSDYWRRSQCPMDGVLGHKEWSHFCVLAPDLTVIVNFSLMDRTSPSDRQVSEVPRVVLILRREGVWDGDLVQFAPEEARIGNRPTDLTIGTNRIEFADGCYHVDVAPNSDGLGAELRFWPLARPAIASSVRLSAGERMRWLVVPRLAAEGKVFSADGAFTVDQAPAYHDRNWGNFRWGADYSWEWATILPTSLSVPWSLVYMRISDGSRNRTFSQSLMVWRDAGSARVFHGADMSIRQCDLLTQRRTLRLPSMVNLMVPGETSNIPRTIEIAANAWSDHVSVRAELDAYAQVGVPNDGPEGLTLLSEVDGEAEVTGRIGREDIRFHGHVLAEFNHAVR